MNITVKIYSGLINYARALDEQELAVKQCLAGGDATLLVLQHQPVVTFGRNFREEDRKITDAELHNHGIQTFQVGRFGSVTYHGPGQLVAYPVMELQASLDSYLRFLQAVIINTLYKFDVSTQSSSDPHHPGVFYATNEKLKKVAAVGVELRRYERKRIVLHGVAVNVNPDLSAFDLIHPCGDKNGDVTSISKILGRPVSVDKVAEAFVSAFDRETPRRFELTIDRVILQPTS